MDEIECDSDCNVVREWRMNILDESVLFGDPDLGFEMKPLNIFNQRGSNPYDV